MAVKHANPCGVAVADTPAEAYRKAFAGDPVSIFGGIIGFNRTVDAETAEELSKIFLEIIVAPDFTEEAFAILALLLVSSFVERELTAIAMPAPKGKW